MLAVVNQSAVATTGDVALLQVGDAVDGLITAAIPSGVEVRGLDDAGQLYAALEKGCPAPCALVIGVGIAQPVRVVQHARSLGAEMPVLILSDGESCEQLEQTLRFAP